jgi:hypothetical protein
MAAVALDAAVDLAAKGAAVGAGTPSWRKKKDAGNVKFNGWNLTQIFPKDEDAAGASACGFCADGYQFVCETSTSAVGEGSELWLSQLKSYK